MVEGERIYREACDEKIGWNTEVNSVDARDWLKWSSQLRNIKVPWSVARDINKIKAVRLHVFADASNTACSAVAMAVVEHSTGFVKGLLTSKSRISKRNTTISRLELPQCGFGQTCYLSSSISRPMSQSEGSHSKHGQRRRSTSPILAPSSTLRGRGEPTTHS